ncbi:MAG: phosphatase PAP2 family protein [Minisyncoccia bacterium]
MKKFWLSILATILFLIITCLVFTQSSFILTIDKVVKIFFAGIHNQLFERFFAEITKIGDIIPVSIFVIALSIVLFVSNKHTKSKILLISSGFAISLGTLIKEITERVRPAGSSIDTIGSSFPSNHSIIATVLCLFFVYEISEYIKIKWQRNIFIISNILLFSLLAFSRIVLSVHWTSDVVAGILLGIICFSISRIVLENH